LEQHELGALVDLHRQQSGVVCAQLRAGDGIL